jgi:hypothetical protein
MAVGAVNRKDRRTALYGLMDAATGGTRLDTHISLSQAPEGREHLYYALEEPIEDEPLPSRGKGVVPYRWRCVFRLAVSRIRYAANLDAAQDLADDFADDVRRSLHEPAAGEQTHLTNIDIIDVRVRSRQHETNEWLIYDITIVGLSALDLAA